MQAQSTSTTCGLKINEVMYRNQQHKAAEMFSGSENEAVDHTLDSWHRGAFSLRLVHFVDTPTITIVPRMHTHYYTSGSQRVPLLSRHHFPASLPVTRC
jgi:hypothetical protein